MIVCPKCKKPFDIEDENIEAVVVNGETKRWQHINCKEAEDNE